MNDRKVKWVEITSENRTYLEDVFVLYDKSFPVEVREPQEIFFKGLQYSRTCFPNNFRFLVGIEGEQVVSFATGHYLACVNSGFIVYIVTNSVARNKGLGSKTLANMESLLNKDATSAGNTLLKSIILETEIKDMVHTKAEKEECMKREYFFEKNGYKKVLEINYLQPPLHGGGEGIPLNLFMKNYQENKLDMEEASGIIRAIYSEKYGLVNGIDKNILNSCLKKMGISY